MKSLKGKYFISKMQESYIEIDLVDIEIKRNKKAYYTQNRAELKEKVIESGTYTREAIEIIEKEGCKKIIANGLTISPFSGYRRLLGKKYSSEIIRGIKALVEAVASDSAEVIIDRADNTIFKSYSKYIEKSPNIFLSTVDDRYPLGFPEVLFSRLYRTRLKEGYFPGKEGILIVPVEMLLRIYLQVEEPEFSGMHPVVIISGIKKIFTWAERDEPLKKLLARTGIKPSGYVIKGDLLNGKIIQDISAELVGETFIFFVIKDTGVKMNFCIECGICKQVCTVSISNTRSKLTLEKGLGLVDFVEVNNCLGCSLCNYFCPGWKS